MASSFFCLLTCYRFLVLIQVFTPKASLQRKHLSFNQSVNDVFCFLVCTGAGMSATKGSPAKSGWSGGGMLEIRKWHNQIWTIRKDLRSYMTSSPDIRAAVRCPPLTDCWTRRAFVLHPRVPVCMCVWQYRWCWSWQLVILAIFAPKAHQPHPARLTRTRARPFLCSRLFWWWTSDPELKKRAHDGESEMGERFSVFEQHD